jgi:hypothetical protein
MKGRVGMKKIWLARLGLIMSVPAMAVNITAAKSDINSVIISYSCSPGEEVRAFALEVTVSDKSFVSAKTIRLGGWDANYYVTPTNVGFTSGAVRPYNSPIVAADANGCIIEMASLYASNDPCVAHKFPPPSSGDLVKLYVNEALAGGDGKITVCVSQVNAKRGGVVLVNATSVAPTGLPACVDLVFDCLNEGQVCGGVLITAAKKANWITAGKPASWCHAGHFAGDANMDCLVNAVDIVGGTGKPNFKAAFNTTYGVPAYAPSCDTNDDLAINAVDLVGGDPTCVGCGAKANFNQTITPCIPVP